MVTTHVAGRKTRGDGRRGPRGGGVLLPYEASRIKQSSEETVFKVTYYIWLYAAKSMACLAFLQCHMMLFFRTKRHINGVENILNVLVDVKMLHFALSHCATKMPTHASMPDHTVCDSTINYFQNPVLTRGNVTKRVGS